MPELALSAESVKRNIDRYWEGARENRNLIKDASKAQQWKFYHTQDGEWRCGPSRFVGYEGMTPAKYVRRKNSEDGGLSGSETQYHLRQWTEDVPETSELHRRLLDIVANYLGEAGVSVNRSARFSILNCTGGYKNQEANDPNEESVHALVILAKSLPICHRRSLIRRLEALK